MKIFTAVFGTETNTFSPFLTGMPNFAQTYLVHHGEHPLPPSAFAVPAVLWRELAQARGWETVESLGAFAVPAGITIQRVYEELRDEILRDLEAAMPVDAVLLNMHGAMVSETCDDCEGDTVARIRALVGPDDQGPAGQPLAQVVVGVPVQTQGDPLGHECPETLPG